MPPLPQLLTIIITTSPVKSTPSTELIERAMETFRHGGEEFAYHCPKVIVCGESPIGEREVVRIEVPFVSKPTTSFQTAFEPRKKTITALSVASMRT